MQSIWDKLGTMLPEALGRIMGLLRPAAFTCLVCGKSDYRPSGSIPSVCGDCRHSIPWIIRIGCAVCGRPERCGDCERRRNASFICSRSAVQYNDIIRQWLALYKYRGHEGLEPVLGGILLAAYSRMHQEISKRRGSFQIDAVIPVPVSGERLQERGFNQAERLAAYIAKHGGPRHFDILRRVRHSGKQSFKTRGERLRDARELFAADDSATLKMIGSLCNPAGSQQSFYNNTLRFLLVDDIYTTGSTVNACAAAIREGVSRTGFQMTTEIYAITLARS